MMNNMQNQMSKLQNQIQNMGGCSANSSFAADGMPAQQANIQNQMNSMGGCSANSSFAADGMSGQQNFMNQAPPIQQPNMQQFGGTNGLMGENNLSAGGNQFGGCQPMPGMQAGYGAMGQTFQHQAGPY